MIEITRGNLLTADAEALVNSVNTDGYMGKGIALQFKKAFPDNFAAYRRACEQGELQPGQMLGFRHRPPVASPLHHQLPDQAQLAGELAAGGHRKRPPSLDPRGQTAGHPFDRGAALGVWPGRPRLARGSSR